jgi:hypothetical protein
VDRYVEPNPDRSHLDAAARVAATLVAARDIEQHDEQDIDALVSAFLCAAWPTAQAQNQ